MISGYVCLRNEGSETSCCIPIGQGSQSRRPKAIQNGSVRLSKVVERAEKIRFSGTLLR